MIPYARQHIDQCDVDAVVQVLRSDFITQGPEVPAFESAVAAHVGARHAVAANSGTSALHIACVALGLQPGDRLWTVPNTFVASANCGRYCGADVDFVDIDALTWNMSVSSLSDRLREAKRQDRLPRVVVPVHFAGQPSEQDAIWQLAQEFGFRVLEDACHSLGASRSGEPVGSCRWSHVTTFSFHPIKAITAGEGGMALTNDDEVAGRMAMLRSHGTTRDLGKMKRPPAGAWCYEQQVLGFNYRMTDIAAALGNSQLGRLRSFLERRRVLAARYDSALKGLPLQLPFIQPENQSAWHLYVVRLMPDTAPEAHRAVFDELRRRGVGVNLHYMPVHLQPYYRDLGFSEGQCPEAEAHGRTAITLPLYPDLTECEQDEVIAALKGIL